MRTRGDALTRLARLDQVFAPRGCAVCRDWSSVELVDDQGRAARPEACPTCGRIVPISHTICLVGVSVETV